MLIHDCINTKLLYTKGYTKQRTRRYYVWFALITEDVGRIRYYMTREKLEKWELETSMQITKFTTPRQNSIFKEEGPWSMVIFLLLLWVIE